MIRKATMGDLAPCVKLACEFFSPFLTKHGVPVRPDDVERVAIMAITNNQMLVIDHDGEICGITAWIIDGHPANSKIKIFYEIIWCVKSRFKTDTLLLLRTMEREAKASGAAFMVMANMATDIEAQIRRILTKKRYTFLETHYGKAL